MLFVFTLSMVFAVVCVITGLIYVTTGITYRKVWNGIIGIAFLALAVACYYFFYSWYLLDQMGFALI